MKWTLGLLAVILGASAVPVAQEEAARGVPAGELTPCPEGPEWTNLLDPRHEAGWEANIKGVEVFEIDDGALHILGNKTGAHVGYTSERFRDFELHVEFKLARFANSGVVIGGELDDPTFTGIEVQLLDDRGREPTRYSSGALYDVATPMFNMSLPSGEWNSLDITCKQRKLIVFMNGWKVLDIDLSKLTMPIGKFVTPYAELPLDGHILVQDHAGEAWFRNIRLKRPGTDKEAG